MNDVRAFPYENACRVYLKGLRNIGPHEWDRATFVEDLDKDAIYVRDAAYPAHIAYGDMPEP